MLAIESHIAVLDQQFNDIIKRTKKETKLSPKIEQARMKKVCDTLLKRKSILELQMFKKKYERIIKHISAVSAGEA
jgi:hypothetical protein